MFFGFLSEEIIIIPDPLHSRISRRLQEIQSTVVQGTIKIDRLIIP
jgi:hypothetical protein